MSRELRNTTRALQPRSDDEALSESEVSELDLTWDYAVAGEVGEASEVVPDVQAESSDEDLGDDDDDDDDGNDDDDDDDEDSNSANSPISDSDSEYDPNASATSEDFISDSDDVNELESIDSDCIDSICSDADSACWSDSDGLCSSDGDFLQRTYACADDNEARTGPHLAKVITIKGPVSVTYITV